MLSWTATYCDGVKLLLKVDDDTLVVPDRMMNWLMSFSDSTWPRNSIIGKKHIPDSSIAIKPNLILHVG